MSVVITNVLDELGIPYRHGGESKDVRSGNVGIACPFCGRGEFSLAVFPKVASCWRCGKHWIGKSLAEASGRPIREVMRLLEGVEPEEPEPDRRGKLVLPQGVGPMQRTHIKYLESRGLNPTEIEDVWGVQGIAIAPRLAWRLFIPVKDRSERMVSWTTRSLNDDHANRYVSAKPEEEIVGIKSVLYGEHLARHGVVVVEGPTDAWRIGPGAVAVLGVDWTVSQMLAIAKYPVRAICFDAEPEAQRRAERLCERVRLFPGQTKLRKLRMGKDPADADQAEIDQIRREFLR